MISVTIFINGKPLVARSARRTNVINGIQVFQTDAGDVVEHKREEGAVKLAIKLLETIKEI